MSRKEQDIKRLIASKVIENINPSLTLEQKQSTLTWRDMSHIEVKTEHIFSNLKKLGNTLSWLPESLLQSHNHKMSWSLLQDHMDKDLSLNSLITQMQAQPNHQDGLQEHSQISPIAHQENSKNHKFWLWQIQSWIDKLLLRLLTSMFQLLHYAMLTHPYNTLIFQSHVETEQLNQFPWFIGY